MEVVFLPGDFRHKMEMDFRHKMEKVTLKMYSVILTTSFYDMNQKMNTEKAYYQNFRMIPILHFQVLHDSSYA